MIKTRFTELVGVEHPIVQGGMQWVGRAELVTPEQESRMTDLVRRLNSDSRTVRAAAQADLKKLGRFAEPTLRRVLRTTSDPALQARIRELLPGV